MQGMTSFYNISSLNNYLNNDSIPQVSNPIQVKWS